MPRGVLAIATLMAFAIWAPLLAVPPVESVLADELRVSHALTSLLFTGPIFMLALIAIPAGFLADRFGIRRVIGAGAVLVAAGSALRGVAPNYAVLLLFTLLYGGGLGLAFPNLPKLARHCGARQRAYITIGVFTASILASGAFALLLTRPFIYPLTDSFRSVAFAWAAPAIVASVLWWVFIKEPPCQSAGVESIAFDLAALRRVVMHRDLWLVAVVFWLHNFFLYTFVGWMPEFLVSIGARPDLAGTISSTLFWLAIPSVLLLSQVSNRLGRRKPFLWFPGIVLIAIAVWALYLNIPMSWALMVISGVATSVRFSTLLSVPVEIVTPREAGSASGLVMAVGYIGALVGPLVGGLILDRTGSYHWIFLSLAIVSVITTLAALLVPETGHKGKRDKADRPIR